MRVMWRLVAVALVAVPTMEPSLGHAQTAPPTPGVDPFSVPVGSEVLTDVPFDVAVGRADLLSASVSAFADGRISLSMSVSEFSDPYTDPNWIVGVSGAEWGFDVDDDGFWDHRATTFNDGTTLTAQVLDAFDQPTCAPAFIDLTPDAIGAHPGFDLDIDASCLGYPATVHWYAAFTYDTELETFVDVVPEGDALSGPVTISPSRFDPRGVNAITPQRVLDTRAGGRTADQRFAGIGTLRAGTEFALPMRRRVGIPLVAAGVMLNVTAVAGRSDGFLTVWPCGQPRPNASSVNFRAGQFVANAVFTAVGTNGSVCLWSPVDVEVIADVTGWVPADAPMAALQPARLLDTRPAPIGATVDGRFAGIGRRQALSITEIPVVDRGGVPAGASAVVLNVTAVEPATIGFITIWSCDQPKPRSSNVNYLAGAVVPNLVVAQVGSRGSVCLDTLGTTDVVIDVTGYVPGSGALVPTPPARLLETRSVGVGGTSDDRFLAIGRRPAGSTTTLDVAGRAGVPPGAAAALLNVTAIETSGGGFVTVWPCGSPMPEASNLNTVGPVVSNAVLAKIGTGGAVCIYTSNEIDMVVDLNGYVPAPPAA